MDLKLKKRIEKLEHPKVIFAGLHRGGSSVFHDIVLHLLKLKTYPEGKKLTPSQKLRPTPIEVGMESPFFFRVNNLEDPALSEESKVELLESKKESYYSIYRVSTDYPVPVMEELIQTKNTQVVLLVRDIRDCVCSGYYSFNLLHGKGLEDPNHRRDYEDGIDRYVIDKMIPKYERALESIKKIQANPLNSIFRYEDMIREPRAFVESVAKIVGLSEDKWEVAWNLLSGRLNYDNVTYDKNKHIRQVFPGNFKKELQKESIEALNLAFEGFLSDHHYL